MSIMKIYRKTWQQHIRAPLDEVWDFFSHPKNLNRITPSKMKFEIVGDHIPEQMYPGCMVEYIVTPMAGISLRWVTEITQVKGKQYFVDEQRIGPYAIWHHEHHFRPDEQGVHMTDILHYAIGYGPFDSLINRWLVEKKVAEIFSFRKDIIEEIFHKKVQPVE